MRTIFYFMARLTIICCFIGLFSGLACPAAGAGLAMFKEFPHQSDATAIPIYYTELVDNGMLLGIKSSSGTQVYEKTKIVAKLDLISTLPENILADGDIMPIRKALDDMNAFSRKYPKAAPTLAKLIASTKAHLEKYDTGNVRFRGKWIAKSEYNQIKEKEQTVLDELKKKDASWQTEMEIKRREREEFERSQRAKGLAEYNGTWLPAEEVKQRLRRDATATAVTSQIDAKSVTEAVYSILQVVDDGMVVSIHRGKIRQGGVNTDVAFLFGANKGMAADGDFYRGDLYWCGNYSYIDTSSAQRTVNAYCLTKNDAINRLSTTLLGESGKTADSAGDSSKGGQSKVPVPEQLKGAKAFGSAFFVGRNGYLITNAHVVGDRPRAVILYEGRKLDARVESVSKAADLALLKVDVAVPGLAIEEKEAAPGSDVFTVGYPMPEIQGLEPKVTKGVISSSKGIDNDSTRFQIDAAIQPGNSGGPLCNSNGQVVGVVVAALNAELVAKRTGSLPQNVNYAIKASEVEAFLRKKSVAVDVLSGDPSSAVQISSVLRATVLVMVY